jgi:soluble lytic murein transglycosylase
LRQPLPKRGNDASLGRTRPFRAQAWPQRRAAALAALVVVALATPWGARDPGAQAAPSVRPAPAARTATAPGPDNKGRTAPAAAAEVAPNPQAREAAYLAHLDAAIAPLLAISISDADAAKIREAIEALGNDKLTKAAELKAEVGDPLGRKLIEWYRLRKGEAPVADLHSFLDQNPDWPNAGLMRRRMEESLFAEGGDTGVIQTYFRNGKPATAAGQAALASVHLAHGDTAAAKAIAATVWREQDLSADLERGFLTRFGELLTQADHRARLDRLLAGTVRWQSDRNDNVALARRVILLLPEAERQSAETRIAAFLRSGVDKADLKPASGKTTDWSGVLRKAQQHRRAGRIDAAAKLMLEAPTDPVAISNLDDWWEERRSLAYAALKANKLKIAYDVVAVAGPLNVNALNQQQFLAGWIALRYLKNMDAAHKHFAAYAATADGPLGWAKSNYWLGRTEEAKGNTAKAMVAYRLASRYLDTFHGLLARQKVDPTSQKITLEPPAEPTAQQIKRFTGLDAAKAVVVLQKAGVKRAVAPPLLRYLSTLEDNEGWSALVAHLARSIGDTQTAVHIGKAAIARGQNLIYYSYPIHALPTYTPLRAPPETAFLMGVARQETEFHADTVSTAGARGLLQVMKVTANHVCHDYKIKCHHDKLLTDNSYNTMLASAYIADRMAELSGSYVLGIAAYNAGPGRAREWIREFGDPRKANVDPVDWIERIPFDETRQYVAKVLSNIQIYRARLGESETALRLDKDLARAREAAAAPQRRNKDGATDTAKSD